MDVSVATRKLIELTVREQMSPAEIPEILVRGDHDNDGDDVIRVKVVFRTEDGQLDPGSVLDCMRVLGDTLLECGERAFPMMRFISEEDRAEEIEEEGVPEAEAADAGADAAGVSVMTRKLIELTAREQLSPAEIPEVLIDRGHDHDGDEVLWIKVFFRAAGNKLDPKSTLACMRVLRDTLVECGEHAFPVTSFASARGRAKRNRKGRALETA